MIPATTLIYYTTGIMEKSVAANHKAMHDTAIQSAATVRPSCLPDRRLEPRAQPPDKRKQGKEVNLLFHDDDDNHNLPCTLRQESHYKFVPNLADHNSFE